MDAAFEDEDTAGLFQVEFVPLPQEEVAQEKGASCGILGKLSVKSGLPLGPINQTIRIDARVDRDVTVHLPIEGQTISDIVIASSSKFESRRNLLNFGPLKRGESAQTVLQVFVRGEHRHDTKLSVGDVDPADAIRVRIGDQESLNNDKTIRYQVTLEIPPGLERINRLGGANSEYGHVVLHTTHPTTKQIPIRVRFSVD
jgi:hypothetical protein